MFKNPFSFEGRIRRLKYGLSQIIYSITYTPFYLWVVFLPSTIAIVLFILYLIPATWFTLAQGAKRCHDRDNPGWWQIIPFYGFWMFFAPGDIGRNEYGENPKVQIVPEWEWPEEGKKQGDVTGNSDSNNQI